MSCQDLSKIGFILLVIFVSIYGEHYAATMETTATLSDEGMTEKQMKNSYFMTESAQRKKRSSYSIVPSENRQRVGTQLVAFSVNNPFPQTRQSLVMNLVQAAYRRYRQSVTFSKPGTWIVLWNWFLSTICTEYIAKKPFDFETKWQEWLNRTSTKLAQKGLNMMLSLAEKVGFKDDLSNGVPVSEKMSQKLVDKEEMGDDVSVVVFAARYSYHVQIDQFIQDAMNVWVPVNNLGKITNDKLLVPFLNGLRWHKRGTMGCDYTEKEVTVPAEKVGMDPKVNATVKLYEKCLYCAFHVNSSIDFNSFDDKNVLLEKLPALKQYMTFGKK